VNLTHEIAALKSELIAVAEKHSLDLLHPEVIRYSQLLDQLIVKAMKPGSRLAS